MKTWIGIGVVIGLALVIGLGTILFRNLGGDPNFVLTSDMARRGLEIATEQGCIACHSLDGSPGIGPTWLGMYGRTETLSDGSTIVVDAAYIRESILQPEAKIVKDYQNLMLEYPLSTQDLNALVEFSRQISQP